MIDEKQQLTSVGFDVKAIADDVVIIDGGHQTGRIRDMLRAAGFEINLNPEQLGIIIKPHTFSTLIETLRQVPIGALEHHPLLAKILDAGAAIEAGDQERAQTLLDELQAEAAPDGTIAQRIAYAFGRGLRARLTGSVAETGNLYTQIDMLNAFGVLLQSTPLVSFGHAAANNAIANVFRGKTHLHLIDLGIGSGLQWMPLFRTLAEQGVTHMRITGLDLPLENDNPNARVGDPLRQQAADSGITLDYRHIEASFEQFQPEQAQVEPGETVAVNAAFALHHLQEEARNETLGKIRQLGTALLVLIEPDSEHHMLPFLPRLREALGHYGTVFDALGTLLPTDMRERSVIEQSFFGREIVNVLSEEDRKRYERHSRYESWVTRMLDNGFNPVPVALVPFDLQTGFTVTEQMGALRLRWRDYPVVSVTGWKISES